ncbi:MAG: DUF3891 family protein [Verrucomicrobia bacterium]|nr:MAG: DUF3891 family protein [Verrucomicrobiota bacterium]
MIRAETTSGWTLIRHTDHAFLAGQFAEAWGNETFPRPEPFDRIAFAVSHHDDGWQARDAAPVLSPDGKPEGFTSALVGAYAAFEEKDLPSYLAVRGEATRAAAALDPLAGLLISMHTVNLLSEQADLATIAPAFRPVHAAFLAEQRAWQATTAERGGFSATMLKRGFEFLQCCDNLSLIACSGLDRVATLRHAQMDTAGIGRELVCAPAGPGTWTVTPWPFAAKRLEFDLPYRVIDRKTFVDEADYRAAFASAPVSTTRVVIAAKGEASA